MTIHIVLADDHELFRTGLRALLERQPDMVVVAEVEDGLKAVEAAGVTNPDVVVMDITMPGMNGIEATQRIAAALPSVKVLALSMHTRRQHVLAVLEAGAAGYMLKDGALEELVLAIRAVVDRQTYLSPRIAGSVLEAYRDAKMNAPISRLSQLTPREREVLQLIAEGHSTQAIATRLGVSGKTVSAHRENLMRKLDIFSIAELTKFAIRHGLTTTDA